VSSRDESEIQNSHEDLWLVRRINIAKWDNSHHNQEGIEGDAIGSSAVTGNLRTENNNLSVWICHDPQSEYQLNKVFLALGCIRQSEQNLTLAWVKEEDITNAGLTIMETDGNTPAQSLVNMHRDIRYLDSDKLIKIARIFADAIRYKRQFKKRPAKKITSILADAVENKLLSLDSLDEDRQEDLIKKIKKELDRRAGK
jgi:hypothetical protein